MARPIVAEISHSALLHNLAVVRQHAPGARVWAVIKANAYGHGAVRVAATLASADGLALLELETACRLREAGEQRPILLLEGVFSADEWQTCAAFNLQVVVHNAEQVAWLAAQTLSHPVTVHLKINSGMQRLGFPCAALRTWSQRLRSAPNVAAVHYLSHFANADAAPDAPLPVTVATQLQALDQAWTGLPGLRSLANSAAILQHPQTHADWVRPGIMLYGATPFAERSAQACGLRAAMTLRSELIAIQSLQAGDAVGYGSRFVADRPMLIGVVAAGYADGYPRHAPDGTPVCVAGVATRLLGRVAMDMLTVDLNPLVQAQVPVQVGMPVELWGGQVPIDAVAQAAGTVGYELMCAVAPRVRVIDSA